MPTPTPQFEWNAALGRYTVNGRMVPFAQIRDALESIITESRSAIREMGQGLAQGAIPLDVWQTQMAQEIKTITLMTRAAAVGGWEQMTPSDFGSVGAELKKQYRFLEQFASDLESGATPLDGRLTNRADLYPQASRGYFEETLRGVAGDQGYTQERRRLGAADHCDDCLEYARRGWKPINTLPPIGDSVCRTNCHCEFEYR